MIRVSSKDWRNQKETDCHMRQHLVARNLKIESHVPDVFHVENMVFLTRMSITQPINYTLTNQVAKRFRGTLAMSFFPPLPSNVES